MKEALKGAGEAMLGALGTAAGRLLGLHRGMARGMYRRLIAWNRRIPDTLTIRLDPLLTECGTALFDLREPVIEEMTLANGARMRLDLSEKTQRQVFSRKLYESGLTRFALSVLKPGDMFIDVGANVGYFAMLAAAAVGPAGRVIALEPERENFAALEANARMNAYQHMLLLRNAAGRMDGETLALHVHPLNRGGTSLLPFSEYRSGDHTALSLADAKARFGDAALTQEVRIRTLDALWREQDEPAIAILKIDVEGFELPVLEGASALLASGRVAHVICELGNAETRTRVLNLFRKDGYMPFVLGFDGTPIPMPGSSSVRDVLFSHTSVSR